MSEFIFRENAIEFLKDAEYCYVSFSQKRFANKVIKLAEKYPEEVTIIAINRKPNGEFEGIHAKMPVRYIQLSNRARNLTDEERKEIGDRLNAYNDSKAEI